MTVAANLNAQNVTIEDGTIKHNDAERPCLVVELDPEPKPLKKAWKSFLKDNYDFKIKGIGFLTNKDLLYAEDLVVEQISAKRIDFYTRIVENEVGSQMQVFIAFGYDIYVDKNEMPEEYKVMKKMLNDFLKSYLPDYYKSEVKDTKKKVKKLAKQVEKLSDDISDNKEKVKDLNKEMEELTEEITEKEAALRTAEIKLNQRKQKLQRILGQFEND